MIELYLDTVDVEHVARLNHCLPIKGVTTNPSILAKAGVGVNQALSDLSNILGNDARFHVQVVSQMVDEMVEEAIKIDALPYDMVVKIPANERGLAAIKKVKKKGVNVLATAIYSTQQGFFAALAGADYLAPYVNRMDMMGANGLAVVADLQILIEKNDLNCTLLPASFKNVLQVTELMKLGVGAITLPVDIASNMLLHPAVEPAVEQFNKDWTIAFGRKLSFES